MEITLKAALKHHAMELRQQAGNLIDGAEVAAPSRDGNSPISPMEPVLSSEAIQAQLQKILSSRTLVQSKRLVRFLSFIVDKGLKGRGKGLNEYLIGIEAYERSSSFDPQIDTIVRSEARRLRLKLHRYYETEGISDPILIEVPKGSYAPSVSCARARDSRQEPGPACFPLPSAGETGRRPHGDYLSG